MRRSGFSLVELMVASGLLGGLAIYLLNISKQQTVVEKRAETSFEINTISGTISQSLLNKDSCAQTLGVGNIINNGTQLNEIRNRSGNVLFNKIATYGNNQLKLTQIIIKDLVTSGVGGGNRYGEAKIDITFEKVSKLIEGNKTINRAFPIQVELSPTNALLSCYSSVDNAVATAKLEMCASLNGVFDVPTDKCNLNAFDVASAPLVYEAVSSQYLNDFYDQRKINDLDPRFVNISGDTMTGKLLVENEIQTTSQFCVGARCRNFARVNCAPGSVVKEILEDGSLVCANVTCPDPNTFYVGITSSGTPICKAFPTNTCSANQYVSKVNADGSVVCSNLPPGTNKTCPGGAIQSIDGSGNHTCVTVEPDTNVFGKLCSTGQVLRGFDSNGNVICENTVAPKTLTVSCSLSVVSQWSSKCVATCPVNYVVVGGGCMSFGGDGYHRYVRKTIPQGSNGWLCETFEDHGSKDYNGGGTGYAICLQN